MSSILILIQDHYGKPSARKISSNIECRGWDPTDWDPNNPWHAVIQEETLQEQQAQEQETPNTPEIIIENPSTNNDIPEINSESNVVQDKPDDSTNNNINNIANNNTISNETIVNEIGENEITNTNNNEIVNNVISNESI